MVDNIGSCALDPFFRVIAQGLEELLTVHHYSIDATWAAEAKEHLADGSRMPHRGGRQ